MQKLRKAFVASVMMVTVLSMSMLTVPMQVGAAVAQNGDLIKMEGLSSVYYLAGGKRYVFPNEATYFSWYSDFSGVVTVPQSELESYPLGANVTMRAGTKLVKITTDPKVYAVEPSGSLVHIPTEAVATTLYGANWAKRVVDIADAFFTNYTVSTKVASASAYPTGSLVKFGGAADIYYIDADGLARKVADEAALAANRFKMSDVITATIVMPTAGANITATETTLVDVSQSGAAVGITPGAGTGLSVSLASDTPASATTLGDSTSGDGAQAMIPVLKANFTASADGAVQVNTVKFKRNHVPSADADFAEFYLYDGETLLAKYNSISESILTFTKGTGLFTVPAGTTKGITLKVNLKAGISASRSYNFSILTAADVVTNGATVSGTFPATGNAMTTAQVSDLGKLTITTGTSATTVDPGKTDHSIWQFTAQATDQDIQIEKMKLTIIGTVDAANLTNFSLEVGGAKITPVVAAMAADKTVTFNFATPYTILKGNTKTITLKGDVVSGTSRTFKAQIYNKEDVLAKDKEYGVYVTPNQADSYTRITAAADTTINAGSLTVSKNLQSPSGNIASGAVNVEIGKFDFKATGEDIKVDTLYLTSDASLYQVKAYVDGAQVGTSVNLATTTEGTITPGNSFIIPAGTTKTLVIKADIKDSVSPYVAKSNNVAVNFQLGTTGSALYTKQTSGSTATAGSVSGNSLTVKTGTLTAAENLSFGDRSSTNPTGVVNSVGAKVASFVLTAGAGESVTVTQISLADYDASTLMGNNFQNMKLMHGTTQIGTTIGTLNTALGTYDFNPSPAIKIAAGEQYVVDVYADIKSGATQTAMNMYGIKFGAVTATGDVTAIDASYNPTDFELQTMYISSVGALYISDDSATPDAAQLVMGATDQEVAKFKLEASAAENLNLTQIIISDSVSSAATGTLTNIKLYDGDTLIAGPVQFSTAYASTTYVHATFNVNLTVPANGSKVLTVKADVSTADAGAVTASTHTFGILANPDSTSAEAITAKGASSGTVLTVSGSTLKFYSKTDTATNLDQTARQMTVYRTKLSVAWASDTPSGSAVGMSDATVAKINVTNSANVGSYAATVKAMNFAISHTGISNTAVRTLKVYKDTITSGNLVATTSWLASQNFGNTALINGTNSASTFLSTEISAGSTKTFIVLVDTSDAGSDDKFSIYMDASDMTWNDGTTSSSDITSVNTLPLSAKTLTY